MKQISSLYLLELKNAVLRILKVMIFSILFVLLIGLGVFIFQKKMSLQDISLSRIGVVLEDKEDTYFPKLLEFVNNVKSINEIMKVEIIDKDEGIDALIAGDILMLMEIPSNFITDAAHMKETEFNVYVLKDGGVSGFKTTVIALLQGVEKLMMITEGAILACYEGMDTYTFRESVGEMENGVFMEYISRFLTRSDYFSVEYLSKYGKYTVLQYYICSLCIFIFLICSMTFLKMTGVGERRLEMIMSKGMGLKWLTALIKPLICGVALFLLELSVLFLLKLLDLRIFDTRMKINGQTLLVLLCIGLFIGGFSNLISVLVERVENRISIYLLLVIIMELLSGSIGSVYYLPKGLRDIAKLWPLTWMRQLLMGSFWRKIDQRELMNLLILGGVLWLVGGGLYVSRLNRHE